MHASLHRTGYGNVFLVTMVNQVRTHKLRLNTNHDDGV